MGTDSKEIVHKLIYNVLVEIRTESSEDEPNLKKIFHLSDLLHNVPLQLFSASNEKQEYDEILNWIKKRAEEKNCLPWVENNIRNNM